jgi:hypothetical protein
LTAEAPLDGPPTSEPPPDGPTIIPFRPGNEAALLTEAARRMTDTVGANLRRATRSAIVGPNHLEIYLPAGYDLARKACERPEVQSRIEAALGEITGESVSVRFLLEAEEASRAGPKAGNEARARRVDEAEDALVKEVAEKFGIQSWRVQELLNSSPSGSDDRE